MQSRNYKKSEKYFDISKEYIPGGVELTGSCGKGRTQRSGIYKVGLRLKDI